MMYKLTHFKEDRDEPEPLSKSERSKRLVVRGSGLRHDEKQVERLVTRRGMLFINICRATRAFSGPLFPTRTLRAR